MRDELNIRELVKIHPDYIGFIFYQESKRFIGENFNLKILEYIPESINKVGVFVKATKEYILERMNIFGLNLVQLHGGEPVEFCKELNNEGISIIKAFGVDEKFDFKTLNLFKPYCKYFLFDTKCDIYGGSSRKFNRDIFKEYDNEKPFFLSGGISLEDADSIKDLENLNIHAVDINSRFELKPGLKDILRIKKFIKKLKY
jgi:phosphoribosylanthranilate isomerase